MLFKFKVLRFIEKSFFSHYFLIIFVYLHRNNKHLKQYEQQRTRLRLHIDNPLLSRRLGEDWQKFLTFGCAFKCIEGL